MKVSVCANTAQTETFTKPHGGAAKGHVEAKNKTSLKPTKQKDYSTESVTIMFYAAPFITRIRLLAQ